MVMRERFPRPPAIPSTAVIRGELVDIVELRGQIRPLHSVDLLAPPDAAGQDSDSETCERWRHGGRSGDVAHRFRSFHHSDDSGDQRRSDLKQAEAQIADTKAKQVLAEQQDMTALQKANYDVERAKLDASKSEILSQIDGEEAKAASRRRRAAAETGPAESADSDVASNKADLVNIEQKREKALRDVQHWEDAISRLTILAPTDGMVHLMPNYQAGGNFGSNPPPFKEGDRAWSMAAIAQNPGSFPRCESRRTLTKKIEAAYMRAKRFQHEWTRLLI